MSYDYFIFYKKKFKIKIKRENKVKELNKNDQEIIVHLERKIKREEMKFKANLWKSYLFHFLRGGHLVSGIITIFFMSWGKLTFLEIMYLQSYFWIMILLLEIPCGAISDYMNRKMSLFLGGFVTAMAALVYSITPNVMMFVVGETLWALGEALISGTDTSITYESLKKLGREDEIAKFSARNISFYVAGIGISSPLGSLLTLVVPIQFVVTLMFIPFIMAGIVSLTLREPNHDRRKETDKGGSYLIIIKSGIKELKHNKNLRTLAIDQVLAEGLVFLIFWTYQPYLLDFGIIIAHLGFIAALFTITQVLFMNLVPKLYERVENKKRLLFVFTIIPGFSFVLLALLRINVVVILLFMIIIGFGMARSIIHVKSINKQIETENRATLLSTINMMSTLIKAILFPIFGCIVMTSLSYSFIIIGIIMVLIALLSRVENEHLL